MKRFLIIVTLMIFGSGCGVVSDFSTNIGVDEEENVLLTSEDLYKNTRFHYAFEVPDDKIVYALTGEQTAIEAIEDSEVVFLVDGELNFFTIRGIDDVRSVHEWLSQNLKFFYPSGEAGQNVEKIGGGQAIVLTGNGTVDSPARVMVIQRNNQLIVISFEQESLVFDQVIKSLTFDF